MHKFSETQIGFLCICAGDVIKQKTSSAGIVHVQPFDQTSETSDWCSITFVLLSSPWTVLDSTNEFDRSLSGSRKIIEK